MKRPELYTDENFHLVRIVYPDNTVEVYYASEHIWVLSLFTGKAGADLIRKNHIKLGVL